MTGKLKENNTWFNFEEKEFIKGLDDETLEKYFKALHKKTRWGSLDQAFVLGTAYLEIYKRRQNE